MASSFRTVKAILHNFKALHLHFINASIDSTSDLKERFKFKGLAQTLASTSFLKNLALMYDTLEELKSTSEFFQLKNVTLAKAVHAVSRLIYLLKGENLEEAPKFLRSNWPLKMVFFKV